MNALDAAYAALPADQPPTTGITATGGGNALDQAYAALQSSGSAGNGRYTVKNGVAYDAHGVPYDSIAAADRATASSPKPADESVIDKLYGGAEAAMATGTGMIAAPVAAWADTLLGSKAGDAVMRTVQYQPTTQAGQRYTQNVGDAINESGIGSVAPLAEMNVISHLPASGKLAPTGLAKVPANVLPDTIIPSVTADEPINTIRLANTEAPGAAVTNRYDFQGNRIAPPAPPIDVPLSIGSELDNWVLNNKSSAPATTNYGSLTPEQQAAVGKLDIPLSDGGDIDAALSKMMANRTSPTSTPIEAAPDQPVISPEASANGSDSESSQPFEVIPSAQSPSSLERLNEAKSLPVPVNLTLGQATQDVKALSNEQNLRAAIPALADRFNEQNTALAQNFDAIRSNVAPDINTAPGVETDQALVDAIKGIDAPVRADITAKYQVLKDANGGQFPLSGQDFVNSADRALKADNVTRFAPPEVRGLLDDLRDGGPMNYNDFENYRTILGQQARKYAQSGDGTAEHAVNLVRDSLESLPMTDEAANIKPLADAARQAAAARFATIKADPAYKAVINDGVPIGEPSPIADKFIEKYVINGKTANVKNLIENLQSDPQAKQLVAAGVIDNLKQKAGIDLRTNTGNISQAALNKAIGAMGQKKEMVLDPESSAHVDSLGNVARYTQAQPRGSYVNNSNTFVSTISAGAKTAVEGLVNFKMHGIPLGTAVRKWADNKALEKVANKALNPVINPSVAPSLMAKLKSAAVTGPKFEVGLIADAAKNNAINAPAHAQEVAAALTLAQRQAENMQNLRDNEARIAAVKAAKRAQIMRAANVDDAVRLAQESIR